MQDKIWKNDIWEKYDKARENEQKLEKYSDQFKNISRGAGTSLRLSNGRPPEELKESLIQLERASNQVESEKKKRSYILIGFAGFAFLIFLFILFKR